MYDDSDWRIGSAILKLSGGAGELARRTAKRGTVLPLTRAFVGEGVKGVLIPPPSGAVRGLRWVT